MTERDFVLGRRSHRDAERVFDRALTLERVYHGIQALRPLGMAFAGPMLLVNGVRQDGGLGDHRIRPSPGSYPALGTPSSTGPVRPRRGRSRAKESHDNQLSR